MEFLVCESELFADHVAQHLERDELYDNLALDVLWIIPFENVYFDYSFGLEGEV